MISNKYAKVSDKLEEQKDKIILSNDAFAVCEFIETLVNKIEHLRRSR